MERDAEQTLFTAENDPVRQVEKELARRHGGSAVGHDPDPPGLLDDEQPEVVAGRNREGDRLGERESGQRVGQRIAHGLRAVRQRECCEGGAGDRAGGRQEGGGAEETKGAAKGACKHGTAGRRIHGRTLCRPGGGASGLSESSGGITGAAPRALPEMEQGRADKAAVAGRREVPS